MKNILLLVISFAALCGSAFAVDASACGTLAAPGLYTLTQNVQANETCFNITAPGVALDCNGHSLAGSNAAGAYGVYSNQINTTVKNCVISKFQHGVYFNGASNGMIKNVTANSTQSPGFGVYLLTGADHNTISDSNLYSSISSALRLHFTNYNAIANTTAASGSSYGMYIFGSGHTEITRSSASSGTGVGMLLWLSSEGTVANSRISGKESNFGALALYSNANKNTIANNTISGKAGTYAITLKSAGSNYVSGNQFINNTIANATTLAYIGAGNSNNAFYWNNFTGSGVYIQDLASGNRYNTTMAGHGEGNIYANVISGSVQVQGNVSSGYGQGLYIGMNGTGYPYNAANSQGKINGNATDYAPLTPNYFNNSSTLPAPGCVCGNLNVPNYVCNVTEDLNDQGTCFEVQAPNVTILCNGHTITGMNQSFTYGILSSYPGTKAYDCRISNFGTGVEFQGVTNGMIRGITAGTTNQWGHGVEIGGGSNNTIINSTGTATAQAGIDFVLSVNNMMINSTGASSTAAGVIVTDSNGTNLAGVAGTSASGPGIYVNLGSKNTISDSSGMSATYTGILVQQSTGNIIMDSAGTSGTEYGIFLLDSQANQITGSNATSALGVGLYLLNSPGNSVSGVIGASGGNNGIWIASSQNNTIEDTLGIGGIKLDSSSGNHIAGTNGTSVLGIGIQINGGSNNELRGSSGASVSSVGLDIENSMNNIVSNTALVSDTGMALALFSSDHNAIVNSSISTNSGEGIYIMNSTQNTVSGSSVSGSGAARLFLNSTMNTFYKNKFIASNPNSGLLTVEPGSFGNTFYWNNFTDSLNYYIQDADGNNHYNTTINGKGEGNIYTNVLGGAVAVQGSQASSGFPALYIGVNGTGFPYSAATAQGMIGGNATDFAPLTPNYFNNSSTPPQGCVCGVLNTPNYICNVTQNLTSNGTCFDVQANNVTIQCNGHSITWDPPTIFPSYAVKSQFVSGTKVRNCNILNYTLAMVINFASNGFEVAGTNITAPGGNAGGAVLIANSYNGIFNDNRVTAEYTALYLDIAGNNALFGNYFAGCQYASACEVTKVHSNGGAATVNNTFYMNRFTALNGNGRLFTFDTMTNGKNTLYWNNFTQTTGYYVSGTTGNYLNSTINGKSEGNIYANVISGAVQVQGSQTSSGFPALYVGMNGTGYPYSATTSQGKIVGNAVDYAPLTPFYFNNSSTPPQGCQCGMLSVPNFVCNVTQDLSANGTCFNVQANNVTILCNGHTLTKIGSAESNGVYIASSGVLVKDCNIQNFGAGIHVNGMYASFGDPADNNTIINNTITVTSLGSWSVSGISILSSRNDVVRGNKITLPMGGTGASSVGIFLYDGAPTTILGVVNSTIEKNEVIAKLAMYVLSDSNGNEISNNTLSGSIALTIGDSSNNRIIKNTLTGTDKALMIYTQYGASAGNVAYWNNFTAASGYYIDDATSANHYNTTVNGKSEGNIYANVISGAVQVQGNVSSGYGSGLYIGRNGTGYPYNAATSQGKIIGSATDYAPLTPFYLNNTMPPAPGCVCGNLNVPNYVCNVTEDLTSTGTCFNVTADNVTILCNGHQVNSTGFDIEAIRVAADSVTVRGCLIRGSHGMWVDGTSFSISNSTVNGSLFGILLRHTPNVSITNNSIACNMAVAISTSGPNPCTSGNISGNTVMSRGIGMSLRTNGCGQLDVSRNIFMGIVYGGTPHLMIDANAGSPAYVYWNNFTQAPQYVSTDSVNVYLNTPGSANLEGNIYADVIDGTAQVQGNAPSSAYPGLYIGTNGSGYPYNAINSGGRMGGIASDNYPLTPFYLNSTAPPVNASENCTLASGLTDGICKATNATEIKEKPKPTPKPIIRPKPKQLPPEIAPNADPNTDPKAEGIMPVPTVEPAPKVDPKPMPKIDPKPNPNIDPIAKIDPKPSPKAEPKPKVEPKPAITPKVEPVKAPVAVEKKAAPAPVKQEAPAAVQKAPAAPAKAESSAPAPAAD